MREFAIGPIQFGFAALCGVALFISNFVIVFNGATLTWWEYALIAIVTLFYFGLIIMVIFEKTTPIKLLTKE
tara:strand:+ start:1284 stop:1499 length:216 start_codon:yes stop_codon:yes gene_type:complete